MAESPAELPHLPVRRLSTAAAQEAAERSAAVAMAVEVKVAAVARAA